MRTTKKSFAIILILSILLVMLTSCKAEPLKEEPTSSEPAFAGSTVKIATLQGPTGMGMAYMLDDSDSGKTVNKYEYDVCASPDEITGKIVSGEYDIAALPTNAAATLYNKSQGKVKLLALNTECVLYILEKGNTIKSVNDLKGKTVYVSGQGSTPEYVLNYVLESNGLKVGTDVKLDFTYATHSDLVAFAATGKADVVLLPEPTVTALLAKNSDMRVALSIDDEWEKVVEGTEYNDSEVAMGCVVVNTKFAQENPQAVEAFLEEYKASIDKINEEDNIENSAKAIVKVGIVAAEGVAKSALPRCNITFESGAEMKTEVSAFLEILYKANPNSVGGKMPDDNFYYGG